MRLSWHRLREGLKAERTALINRGRGLLLEFGRPIARSPAAFQRGLQAALHDASLPAGRHRLLNQLAIHLRALDERLAECERDIQHSARHDPLAQRLQRVPGIGPISADALVASVGDAREFKNGRQFNAWQGLVPRQHSSGGKPKLGGISRRGDPYLRTLLIQGAKSTLQAALKRIPSELDHSQRWIVQLHARVGYHKTLAAIANKHARQAWVILARGESDDANAWQQHPAAKAA